MSSGKEQQCITTSKDKNQSAEERNQDTQRFVRQVRSGQVSHTQEAHRRREGSGSRDGRGNSRLQGQGSVRVGRLPRATATAGEPDKDREALRIEGIQAHAGAA